ncbi:DUF2283 domain-containing protein [Spirillospora sp. NPDC048819]|uniref:DUF2283 domain-containing protein n=1 Tax=Spirillospora sp. NPDC048819 TaxID=3155268 RepID=UPI0033F7FAD5
MSEYIERNAKIRISTEVDALYIQLAHDIRDGESVKNESFTLRNRESELILDLTVDNQLLGIEIIGIGGLLKE